MIHRETDPPERRPRIVVLGGINTDYVIKSGRLPAPGQSVQGEDLFVGPGGKGANQAVAASRLGARVEIIGRVGDEARGRDLAGGLRQEQVGTRHVSFDSERVSGAAIIAVEDHGEKQISAALGANLALRPREVNQAEKIIARADLLLVNFEVPMPCVLAAARLARKHEVKMVVDPAPPAKVTAELFKLIFAIRPNAHEAEQLTGIKVTNRATARRACRALLQRGVQIAAMEAGDEGDLVISRDEEVFVRRLKVKSIDATGAGDAFAAAFSVALAQDRSLREAAAFANAAAALATTKVGAQNGMPSRKAVEQLLTRRRG